jgi:hypothetical protein
MRLEKKTLQLAKLFTYQNMQSVYETVILTIALIGLFDIAMNLLYRHTLNGGF